MGHRPSIRIPARGGLLPPELHTATAGAAESSELVRQELFSENLWKPATDFHPTSVGVPRTPASCQNIGRQAEALSRVSLGSLIGHFYGQRGRTKPPTGGRTEPPTFEFAIVVRR